MPFLGTYSSASIRGWKAEQTPATGNYSLSAVIPSSSFSYDVNSNGTKIATISYDTTNYTAKVINVTTQTIEYTSSNISEPGDISFNVQGNVVYFANIGTIFSTTFDGSSWSNQRYSYGEEGAGVRIKVGGNNTVFFEAYYRQTPQSLRDAAIYAGGASGANRIWTSSLYLGETTDGFDVSRGSMITNLVIGDDGLTAPGGVYADQLVTIVGGSTKYYGATPTQNDTMRIVAINSNGNVFVTCRSTLPSIEPTLEIWILSYDGVTFIKSFSSVIASFPSSIAIGGVNNIIAASYSNITEIYALSHSFGVWSITLLQTIPQQGNVKFSDDGSTLVILSNNTLFVYKL